MSVVGQIAKDIFTSYGEILTKSGKFLRDNRKKILGWTVGGAVPVAAAYYGGAPVAVMEIGAGICGYSLLRLPIGINTQKIFLPTAILIAGLTLFMGPGIKILATDTETLVKKMDQALVLRSKSIVRNSLMYGDNVATDYQTGTSYFNWFKWGAAEIKGSASGEAVCRSLDNTNLLLKIDGSMEHYTRPDSKSEWKSVKDRDFNFKLACGSGS